VHVATSIIARAISALSTELPARHTGSADWTMTSWPFHSPVWTNVGTVT
jgi:hypothetical protein